MADDSKHTADATNNATFGLETQRKVELYFLALAFTVTGLAIQSAKFTANHWQCGLEVTGWICLATAGVIGLIRMQRVPPIFAYSQQASLHRRMLSEIRNEPAASNIQIGDTVLQQPLAIEDTQAKIDFYRSKAGEINKLVGRLGKVQTWVFVAGLVLSGASRAYAGFIITC